MKRTIVIVFLTLIALFLGACSAEMAKLQPPKQKTDKTAANAPVPLPPPPMSSPTASSKHSCPLCAQIGGERGVEGGVVGGVVGGVFGGVPGGVIGGYASDALAAEIPQRAKLEEKAFVLDELRKPYVVTARAKGASELGLLLKYPVRLALNPFVSGIGNLFPALISGGAIVAIVLSLPLVGPVLVNALMSEDVYLAGSMLMVMS